MTRPNLSHRVQMIYDYLVTYCNDHGYPPSVREIGDAVGLKSPSTVHMHLQTLEQKGLIRRTANKSRTIELVEFHGRGSGAADAKDAPIARVDIDADSSTLRLPLVGRVAAGVPILAEQNVEESFTLPTGIVGDNCSFMLRVKGDSMINAGIFDGDYLVVRETADAVNGEIVVALVGDGATVKTFYREKDRCRLQPENDAMDPIYVKSPRILGRVTALLRTIS